MIPGKERSPAPSQEPLSLADVQIRQLQKRIGDLERQVSAAAIPSLAETVGTIQQQVASIKEIVTRISVFSEEDFNGQASNGDEYGILDLTKRKPEYPYRKPDPSVRVDTYPQKPVLEQLGDPAKQIVQAIEQGQEPDEQLFQQVFGDKIKDGKTTERTARNQFNAYLKAIEVMVRNDHKDLNGKNNTQSSSQDNPISNEPVKKVPAAVSTDQNIIFINTEPTSPLLFATLTRAEKKVLGAIEQLNGTASELEVLKHMYGIDHPNTEQYELLRLDLENIRKKRPDLNLQITANNIDGNNGQKHTNAAYVGITEPNHNGKASTVDISNPSKQEINKDLPVIRVSKENKVIEINGESYNFNGYTWAIMLKLLKNPRKDIQAKFLNKLARRLGSTADSPASTFIPFIRRKLHDDGSEQGLLTARGNTRARTYRLNAEVHFITNDTNGQPIQESKSTKNRRSEGTEDSITTVNLRHNGNENHSEPLPKITIAQKPVKTKTATEVQTTSPKRVLYKELADLVIQEASAGHSDQSGVVQFSAEVLIKNLYGITDPQEKDYERMYAVVKSAREYREDLPKFRVRKEKSKRRKNPRPSVTATLQLGMPQYLVLRRKHELEDKERAQTPESQQKRDTKIREVIRQETLRTILSQTSISKYPLDDFQRLLQNAVFLTDQYLPKDMKYVPSGKEEEYDVIDPTLTQDLKRKVAEELHGLFGQDWKAVWNPKERQTLNYISALRRRGFNVHTLLDSLLSTE